MAERLRSDFSFGFQCSPCTDEGLSNIATKVCTKCNLYLCVSCIKAHDRLFKTHATLNKEEFQRQSQHGDQQLTDICIKHDEKLIDMYCEDDDVVGCAVCIALNHRFCETIQYIPEMTIDQNNTNEFDETMKQVSACRHKYLCMKAELRNELEIESKGSIEILELVEQNRLQLNSVIDKFQDDLLSQVRDRNVNVKEIIECATLQYDNALKSLKVIENNMKTSEAMDHTKSFIALKVAKQAISERKVIDEHITEFEIPELILVKDLMQAVGRVIEKTSLLLLSSPLTDVCEPIRLFLDISSDKCVGLLCSLPNGHVICTDSIQKKVYEFDAFNNLLHSIDVAGGPIGLCMITEDEVAITIPDEKKVQFLKLDDGFEMAESFAVDWKSGEILKCNYRLYIIHNDEKNVGMYNLDGKLLGTIDRDESDNKLFTDPRWITCNSDQSKVYIWDGYTIIKVFDANGNHLRSIYVESLPDEHFAAGSAESLSDESSALSGVESLSDEPVELSWNGSLSDEPSAISGADSLRDEPDALSGAESLSDESDALSREETFLDEHSAVGREETLSDISAEHILPTTDGGITEENDTLDGDGKMVIVHSFQGVAEGLWYEVIHYRIIPTV